MLLRVTDACSSFASLSAHEILLRQILQIKESAILFLIAASTQMFGEGTRMILLIGTEHPYCRSLQVKACIRQGQYTLIKKYDITTVSQCNRINSFRMEPSYKCSIKRYGHRTGPGACVSRK